MFKQLDFRENVNTLSVLLTKPYVIFPIDGHALGFFWGKKGIISIIDTLLVSYLLKTKNKNILCFGD